MAITEVQNNQTESGSFAASAVTCAFGSTTTGANLIVVAVAWYLGGGTTVPAITDNKGNTYTKAVEQDASAEGIAIFYAKKITGGSGHQITATPGGTTFISLSIVEYSGCDTSTPLGTTSVGNSATASSAPAASSITPTSGDLLFAAMTHDTANDPVVSAGSGFTLRGSVHGVSGVTCGSEDAISAGSSLTPAFSLAAAAANWAAAAAVFHQASGGGGSVYPFWLEFAGSVCGTGML